MSNNKTVLIAGGTGLVGKELSSFLKSKGYTIKILTRKQSNPLKKQYQWDVKNKTIDPEALEGVGCVINLVGAGIADKKWTAERKKELVSSRVEPAKFLAEVLKDHKAVTQYISASGINCYGYNDDQKVYRETDAYGNDFLSQVVQQWEQAADLMPPHIKVAKLRISVVLTNKGGALPKIAKPINMYAGAALGSGKQWMPWIAMHDLCRLFEHITSNDLEGTYNALSGAVTNKEFTKQLAKFLNKPLWLPNVPAFFLKIILGEMSSVVLEGLNASNKKILDTGFEFKYDELIAAFKSAYQ